MDRTRELVSNLVYALLSLPTTIILVVLGLMGERVLKWTGKLMARSLDFRGFFLAQAIGSIISATLHDYLRPIHGNFISKDAFVISVLLALVVLQLWGFLLIRLEDGSIDSGRLRAFNLQTIVVLLLFLFGGCAVRAGYDATIANQELPSIVEASPEPDQEGEVAPPPFESQDCLYLLNFPICIPFAE